MTKGTDKKKKKTVVQSVPVLAKCSVIFSTKRLFKYSFCVCSPKLKTYQQYKKEVLFFFSSVWSYLAVPGHGSHSQEDLWRSRKERPSAVAKGGCQIKLLLEQFPLVGYRSEN